MVCLEFQEEGEVKALRVALKTRPTISLDGVLLLALPPVSRVNELKRASQNLDKD